MYIPRTHEYISFIYAQQCINYYRTVSILPASIISFNTSKNTVTDKPNRDRLSREYRTAFNNFTETNPVKTIDEFIAYIIE